MVKQWLYVVGLVVFFSSIPYTSEAGKHRFGMGAHYWRSVDSQSLDNVKDSGFATVISYQYRPAPLFRMGVDLEMLPSQYGGAANRVYAPQAYALVGSIVYAALGVGGYYSDGRFAKDPFFNLRAGLDFSLLPFVSLDISAHYRFEEWGDLKDIDENISSDTITLGAAIRVKL